MIKSLYKLKQAPKYYFFKFSNALKTSGFLQSHSDNSLFTFAQASKFVAVLVYVDDILITDNDVQLIIHVKTYMSSKFYIKDLSPLKYFLGIKVARSTKDIYLHQRKYTLDILTDTGLINTKPSKIHMEQDHTLTDNKSALLSDNDSPFYKRLVGRLIYLTVIRPDLSRTIIK